MPETQSKPIFDHNGEWIGLEITGILTKEEVLRRYPEFALIDAALAPLMQAAKDHADACSFGDECALATALAPWEPEP